MPRFILTLFLLAFTSCAARPSETPSPSAPQWAILSLSLDSCPEAEVLIDNEARSVSIVLPYGSKVTGSRITIRLPEGLTSIPQSGETVDLGGFHAVYLSRPDGSAERFSVNLTVAKSSSTALSSLTETRYRVKVFPVGDKFVFRFPHGADLSHLSFSADTREALQFEPDISDIDLSSPREVTVTAEDGKTKRTILLEAGLYPKDTGVRGVYLPAPSHTGSFLSYSNVCSSIDLLSELHFNCLFVCAWAASRTAWDSDVLAANSTWTSARAGNMYASYSGGSGDALRDIIEVAHGKGIKVILWFEYGFMHGIGGVDWKDPVLARHPEWIGIRSDGTPCNYNGTDYYMNGYDPQVQDFMLDLMQEALRLYPEVDGIQGDDRLPAMPRDAGYDEGTRARYLAETGKEAPSNYNQEDWVRWRLDELNAFAARMHAELKAVKPSLVVCFAPNKYPWCENVLMQDWPGWIADGSVDLLTVQCYVIANYADDVSATMEVVRGKTSVPLFNPAMILKNGETVLSPDQIASQLQINRQAGTFGESQFWFDGLRSPEVQRIFRDYYADPVPFPDL